MTIATLAGYAVPALIGFILVGAAFIELFAWAACKLGRKTDDDSARIIARFEDDGGMVDRPVQKLPESPFEHALRKQVAAHRKQRNQVKE